MKPKKNYIILIIGILIGIVLTGTISYSIIDNFKKSNSTQTNNVFETIKKDNASEETEDTIIEEETIETGTDKKEDISNNKGNSVNNSNDVSSSEDKKPIKNNDANNKTNTKVDIVTYFNNLNSTIFSKENIKKYSEKAKSTFIEITDFLFYGTEFNGYTFNELSDNVKLKIMGIIINIDDKMEQYFPNYKEIIKTKYNDIKQRVIAKYLETSNKICEELGTDSCDEAKNGLLKLRESFNLTFDIIKALGKTGIENLKGWYEVFRQENGNNQ